MTALAVFYAGANSGGTSAQPLTIARKLYHGVTVSIDPAESGTLFVGHSAEQCNYALVAEPGMNAVFIPIDSTGKVWVRGSAPDTGYQWVAS